MKWLVILLVGMAIGAVGTITAAGAMRQETPLHRATMAITSHQFRTLREDARGSACDATQHLRRLRLLRDLGGDFEAAFLPNGRDELFRRRRDDYLAQLDAALAAAPATCATLAARLAPIGRACKGCHDDFRP